jgi:tRNA threonylcarbamoyladenosine biosynthesis protein TsaB
LAQEIFENLGDAEVFIVLDARMEEVYFGEYQIDSDGIMQSVVSDKLIKAECIKIDNAAKIYNDVLIKDCNINLQAKTMIKIAITDFAKGLVTTTDQALPVYLREEIAWGTSK